MCWEMGEEVPSITSCMLSASGRQAAAIRLCLFLQYRHFTLFSLGTCSVCISLATKRSYR